MTDWLARTIAREDAHPGPRRLVANTLSALALVVLIGVLDSLTGSEYIMAILCLVPILLATLYINRVVGFVVATASAVTWFSSDIFVSADR